MDLTICFVRSFRNNLQESKYCTIVCDSSFYHIVVLFIGMSKLKLIYVFTYIFVLGERLFACTAFILHVLYSYSTKIEFVRYICYYLDGLLIEIVASVVRKRKIDAFTSNTLLCVGTDII